MTPRRSRLRYASLAVAGIIAMLAGAASARPAADDVSIDFGLGSNGRLQASLTTVPPAFQIFVSVDTTSGVQQTVKVTMGALPDGLRWGADAPDPTEGCTADPPVVCTGALGPNSAGTVGIGWFWDVVAARPGLYEVTGSVEPTEADPNLANNSATFRFEVVQPSTGGGGAGGGSASEPSASPVKLTPSRPKAGAVVAATVRVTAGGAPVRPSAIACAGTIGSAKLKGNPKAASGSATCVYRTLKSAKGKTLRGSVSFSVRDTKFTKRFSAKLG